MAGRFVVALLLMFALAGCMAADDPLDQNLVESLQGKWVELNGGHAIFSVYIDGQAKLIMPDEKPPLRVLSELEAVKDHGLGFSVGDRWGGPVYVIPDADNSRLQLNFPPEDPRKNDGRVLHFKRAE